MNSKSPVNYTQYLFFMLGDETYALKGTIVQEIVDYSKVTFVPKVHKCIKGVTNIRGELIGVIDPKIRFGMDEVKVQKRTSFIIVKIKEDKRIALVTDLVIQIDDVSNDDVLQAPEFGTKIEEKYIENILRYENEYISVLDINTIVDIEELSKEN